MTKHLTASIPRTGPTPSLLLACMTACTGAAATPEAPPAGSAGSVAVPGPGAGSSAAGSRSSGPNTTTGSTTSPTSSTTPTTSAGASALATAGSAAPGVAGASAYTAGNGAAAGSGTAGGPAGGDCEGFKLAGLMYSPGGSVLPNTCMPFHPTTNNPYAVRCVDAWPWYKTKYPGDDFCILPPPPDKGVQYGVHPQGSKWYEQVSKGDMSGYENLSDDWLMNDGEEEQANYETVAHTTADANFYRSYARMRMGSHHMIVNSDPSKPGDDKWYPISESGLVEGAAGLLGALGLPGAQRPDENRPPSLEKPPEDA